jgi:hypothetical protein
MATSKAGHFTSSSQEDAEDLWETLFELQKSYRSENKMTGTAFLRQLKLPPTLLPYLYSTSRRPSKKSSSLGGKLRAALKDLIANPPENCEINNSSDLVQEHFIEHRADFTDHGIFAVNIGAEGELQIYAEKDIDVTKVRELFADFEVSTLMESFSRITVSVFLPAAKFDAPVAIRSGLLDGSPILGFGTLTPIRGYFGLFGLTARHCVLGPDKNPNDIGADVEVYQMGVLLCDLLNVAYLQLGGTLEH